MVHAPLPPGVPYERQQIAALSMDVGYPDVPAEALARLAARLGERISAISPDHTHET